jgi:hypothetical protein
MPVRDPQPPCRASTLARDTRGGVFVEYVLVALAGLLIAIVLAGLGPALVSHYSTERAALYRVYP